MARIDTVTESNGPDRFNLNPGCSRHHAGVRTGISDYCCCCDPCNYVRRVNSASPRDERFCCRCIPRLIVAKFTAATDYGCCRNVVVPMVAQLATVNTREVVKYTGSLVGVIVTIYLSNGPVTAESNPYDAPCQWTISIPALGIYEEIEIDHKTVTCLGVPEISITNVTAFEGCIGTLSLINYATVKVPFQSKPSGLQNPESLTVPFPEGFESPTCSSLPRQICISKKHNRENRIRSPKIPWEIEWARDFIWEEYFVPYFAYDQQEWIVGRWVYTPENDEAFEQSLFLVQDLYDEFYLQPDFEGPSTTDGEGEIYSRVPLSSCGCEFKILNVRPVDDPSPPAIPGESLPDDLLGIDYRAGRCGCWSHQCGRRRCVPRYLCGYLFVNNVLYRNILFTWSNDTKSWLASGGEDLNGYSMPFDLNIRLENNADGQCQLAVDYEDFEIEPVLIGDTNTVLSGVLQGTNYAGDGYFYLNFNTSFDGDCELLIVCQTATPCAQNCGSHPPVLNLRLHGYSLPSDIPPPPVTGECTTEIELVYWQTVTVSGTGVLIACGYRGFKLVESYFSEDNPFRTGRKNYLIKAELNLGNLTITRIDPTKLTEGGTTETVVFPSQSCDPYYAYKLTPASLRSCFFGDIAIIWHRWEAEVTE